MTTAVHGGAYIDPARGDVVRGGVTVLIEDGRIVARGPRDQVHVPAGAIQVDAGDLTLLPGLIDCHVHLCVAGDGVNIPEKVMTPPTQLFLQCVPACKATLEAGFTAVRDAGGTPNGVRRAVERGYFPGPRMRMAIQILSQTGGHADDHFPCGAQLPLVAQFDVPPSVVDGVEPMRKRVRELIQLGADWIKLCTSGGVLSPGDAPHHATFTVDEIRTAVEEAATQGRQVMAHAQANAGIKNALRSGVKTIEHGIWLDGDAIELMLDGDRRLVPTLIAPLWVIRHAEAGKMPAYAAEKSRQVIEDHKESIRQAIEAGVKIAFGTDTGVGPHGSNNEEFRLLRQLGMSPLECIRSATTVAAETIGLAGQAGTLAEGAFGDLIGVDGDPLDDVGAIANAANVKLVVKGGEVFKNSTLH
ncbi:MAG TPA: amidohydrolase family protein [Candidatus Dormibacteraeota bacterium]